MKQNVKSVVIVGVGGQGSTRSIPAAGALVKPEDQGEEQLSLL